MIKSPTMLFYTSSILVFCSYMLMSYSIWMLWFGLEILSILLMLSILSQLSKSFKTKGFLYFMFHVVSSAFILLSLTVFKNMLSISNILLFIGIYIKLGGYPFSIYYFKLVRMMPWNKFLFFMVYMKVIPLLLINISALPNSMFLLFIASFSSLGTIHALQSDSIREILVCSSMLNMGWILLSFSFSSILGWTYYLVYSFWFMVAVAMMSEISQGEDSVQSLIFKKPINLPLVNVLTLTLVGIPPFGGFFIKAIVVTYLVVSGLSSELLMILLTSVLPVYLYMKLLVNLNFSKKTLSNESYMWYKNSTSSFLVSFVLMLFLNLLLMLVLYQMCC